MPQLFEYLLSTFLSSATGMKLPSALVNFGDFCKRNHQQLVSGLITLSLSSGILGLRESGAFKEVELWGYDNLMRSQREHPSLALSINTQSQGMRE